MNERYTGSGSFSLSGAAITLYTPIRAIVEGGSFSLSGTSSVGYLPIPATVEGGSITISGTALVTPPIRATVEGGFATLSGDATYFPAMTPEIGGSVTISGVSTASISLKATIEGGLVSLSGIALVTPPIRGTVEGGSAIISGTAVCHIGFRFITESIGEFNVSGAAITTYGYVPRIAEIEGGSVTISGASVTAYSPRRAIIDGGSIVISGEAYSYKINGSAVRVSGLAVTRYSINAGGITIKKITLNDGNGRVMSLSGEELKGGILQTKTERSNFDWGTIGNNEPFVIPGIDVVLITKGKNSEFLVSARYTSDDTNSSTFGVGIGYSYSIDYGENWTAVTQPARLEWYQNTAGDSYKVARMRRMTHGEIQVPKDTPIVFRIYGIFQNSNGKWFGGNPILPDPSPYYSQEQIVQEIGI